MDIVLPILWASTEKKAEMDDLQPSGRTNNLREKNV